MKVLIIRFSSIGDIVLTSPVIRCVKQQLKNAQVHFLTKKQFAPILESNPYIDKLHVMEKNISEVIPLLKEEDYDFIVDLHHNLRSAQVKSALKKKSKSFRKLNIEKWLVVNLKINRLPAVHIVDRYFETVELLGVTNDGKGLDYFIPQKEEIDLNTLPGFQSGYVGCAIGAKYFTKQLPKEKLFSIVEKIQQPVILLGGEEDFEKGEWIVKEVQANNKEKKILNACGKFGLNQSASLVKQASKIITHDTGLMHIAAAFKKEIASVWGNTIPEFGMYPYYGTSYIPNLKSQISNLSCRPCSKLGYAKCPKSHFKCMMQIDEVEIIRFLQK